MDTKHTSAKTSAAVKSTTTTAAASANKKMATAAATPDKKMATAAATPDKKTAAAEDKKAPAGALKQEYKAPYTSEAKIEPKVLRFVTERHVITSPEMNKILQKQHGIPALPLATCRVTLELKGVPTIYSNALRRVAVDELKGKCLVGTPERRPQEPSDMIMYNEQLESNISSIALRAQIPQKMIDDLVMELFVENKTADVLPIYSRDIKVVRPEKFKDVLFNPTFKIGFVQPGFCVRVSNIHITQGYGRVNALYNTAHKGGSRILDVPQVPRKETHSVDGAHADHSGYTISPLVANPRHHEISVTLSAVGPNPGEAKSIFVDACQNIKDRLRKVQIALEQSSIVKTQPAGTELKATQNAVNNSESGTSQLIVTEMVAGLVAGDLILPNETDTIGGIIARTVHELEPDIAYVSYVCIAHEKCARIILHTTGDVRKILQRAIRVAYAAYDSISEQL